MTATLDGTARGPEQPIVTTALGQCSDPRNEVFDAGSLRPLGRTRLHGPTGRQSVDDGVPTESAHSGFTHS